MSDFEIDLGIDWKNVVLSIWPWRQVGPLLGGFNRILFKKLQLTVLVLVKRPTMPVFTLRVFYFLSGPILHNLFVSWPSTELLFEPRIMRALQRLSLVI